MTTTIDPSAIELEDYDFPNSEGDATLDDNMVLRIDSIAQCQIKGRLLQRACPHPNRMRTNSPVVIFEGDEMMGGTLKVYLVPERVVPP